MYFFPLISKVLKNKSPNPTLGVLEFIIFDRCIIEQIKLGAKNNLSVLAPVDYSRLWQMVESCAVYFTDLWFAIHTFGRGYCSAFFIYNFILLSGRICILRESFSNIIFSKITLEANKDLMEFKEIVLFLNQLHSICQTPVSNTHVSAKIEKD